uniref:Adaptor protein ClpS core domain-containing protein n=1 Tax=Hanusia phi TaxID=3032 RepID=A0A7S0HC99_9CRYP|mmetsp:Transcript_12631/g.29066  ORF Transcript_12631/g.29066 Transcript_12631/m.29066 type:complete len:194 (+) Transcript_12631:87-668(+)
MVQSSCVLLGLLLLVADANGFGFSPMLNLRKDSRMPALCQRQTPLAAVMMARPGDGGASKINKGGSGGGNVGGKGGPNFSQDQEGGGAGVAVLTKPPDLDKAADYEKKEQVDKEPIWRVLLHNDDVHTFDYVIDTIVKVVRTVTRKKAHRITMEAHKSGLATVTTTWKQLAREYSLGLQKAGLTSSIAPEKKC